MTRVVGPTQALSHRIRVVAQSDVVVSSASTSGIRDESLRGLYIEAALSQIPRLLSSIDRNPYRDTYGCMDRQFWHYRTADFPSEMYQEGALALAQVYHYEFPGNRWYGEQRIRELAAAAIRFAAGSCHRDGSCDDYYPYERALGAAVFSLQANTRAYQLLELEDPQIAEWFRLRADWLMENDESGHLANHQALAALGLHRVFAITQEPRYLQAAEQRLQKLFTWQSDEGWFNEYGGADPGYQTVTIDSLAKLRREMNVTWFDEPLTRAVNFCRSFLHPDGSYGGPYGSRGTMHFYPHGFELLANTIPAAGELADGFLRALCLGTTACFDDDRLVAHRLGNLIEAYLDWQPHAAAMNKEPNQGSSLTAYPKAGLYVHRNETTHTIISTSRGGTLKHYSHGQHIVTDAGLILETSDGRVAVSQLHDHGHAVHHETEPGIEKITVNSPLRWTAYETATPLKFIALRTFMLLVGRWCRTFVRRLLQRRLITGRDACPIRLTRTLEINKTPQRGSHTSQTATPVDGLPGLRVIDTIELLDPKLHVRRMSFGVDHESAYVAATGVYQHSALSPWNDLAPHLETLNRDRLVRIEREYS